jgi:hypothetical protein
VPGDPGRRSVADALVEERERLLPLPAHRLCCDEVKPVASGKTPYIRFDLNDYSIPHDRVGQTLILSASHDQVRLATPAGVVVATHHRSWDRGRRVENEQHLLALAREKRRARDLRGRDRLRDRCPTAQAFLVALARRNAMLGSQVRRLSQLLDHYGESDVDAALRDCLERGAVSAASVAHMLDQQAHRRGLPPPIPVVLPDDELVRELDVAPHDLADYDELGDDDDDQGHENPA